MRNIFILLPTILLLCTLGACKKNSGVEEALPVLDFRQDIPEKEVTLQDIGNVRYIRFHTSDSILLGDHMRLLPCGDKLFFYDRGGGDVLGFDKDGNSLSRFNHKGQGADEYTGIYYFAFDQEKAEVFICAPKRIQVYGMDGRYKRSLPIPDSILIDDIISLNGRFLLLSEMRNTPFIQDGELKKYAEELPDPNPYPFLLMDKETGKIEAVPVRSEGRFQNLVWTMREGKPFILVGRQQHFFPASGKSLLSQPAADTLYAISPSRELVPMFARLPLTKEKDGKIGCALMAATSRIMLVDAVFLKDEGMNQLKRQLYVYDINKKSPAVGSLVNVEFEGYNNQYPVVSDNKLYFILYPHVLLEAKENHKLSGKLLEITETLDEEDNPVLVEVELY